MRVEPEINTTLELISALQARRYPQVCISTHPERWRGDLIGWLYSFGFDHWANLAKLAIHAVSRYR